MHSVNKMANTHKKKNVVQLVNEKFVERGKVKRGKKKNIFKESIILKNDKSKMK